MRENSSGPPPAPRPRPRPPDSKRTQAPSPAAGPSPGLPETLRTERKEQTHFALSTDLLILLWTLTVLFLSSFWEAQRVKMRWTKIHQQQPK